MKSSTSLKHILQSLILAGLVYWLVLRLMQELGVGCDNTICHKNGYKYGVRLLAGSVVLAFLGRIVLAIQSHRDSKPQPFRLFTSIATGFVVLMVYVYARSLFNHLATSIPITRAEIFTLLAALGGWAFYQRRTAAAGQDLAPALQGKRLLLELVIWAAICVVIAGRELPRETLLSSDPDFHAFFGRQIVYFGAVPFQQGDWGPQGFNYPAGSGVVLFIWYLISGLKPMDSLIATPILFTLAGGLVVAESLVTDLKSTSTKTTILIAALALTAGGLLYPLYSQYAHMEGSARQMSILFVALFMSFSIGHFSAPEHTGWRQLVLPTLILFVLMALNPANIVIPAATLFTMMVMGMRARQNSWKFAVVLLGGLLLSALDPYYHTLIGIAKEARIDTVIYADHLIIKQLPDIARETWHLWTHNLGHFFHDLSVLLAEDGMPLFLPMVAAFGLASWVAGARVHNPKATALAIAAFAVSFYLVYGFSLSLTNDRRFFLLAPYIYFSLSQYKAMLLVLLLALTLKKLSDRGKGMVWLVAASACLILPAQMLIRSEQGMFLDPRQPYCGVFGCIAEGDRRLLREFRAMVKKGDFPAESGVTPKVLVANLISQSEIETWIFPEASGRLLPYFDVLPEAFYYYQGDLDYGTASYLEHVCNRFDRQWLLSKHIRYIFLPSQRKQACIAGLDGLIQSEEVVLQNGNAYLLKIKDPR